jgi:hypothetical protein
VYSVQREVRDGGVDDGGPQSTVTIVGVWCLRFFGSRRIASTQIRRLASLASGRLGPAGTAETGRPAGSYSSASTACAIGTAESGYGRTVLRPGGRPSDRREKQCQKGTPS